MIICNYCKKKIDNIPHACKYCGKYHCQSHLLPESHNCKELEEFKKKRQERWNNIIKEGMGKIYEKEKALPYIPKTYEKEKALPYIPKTYEKFQRDSRKTIKLKNKEPYLKYTIVVLVIFFLVFVLPGGGIFNLIKPKLNCSDGTIYNYCSHEKPLFCFNGTIVNNSEKCGCPYDYKRYKDSCGKIQRCSDGTDYGICSSKKPLYCSNGMLLENSSECGCPYDYVPQGNKCISKYQTNPKTISLTYVLRGNKKSFNWEVYKGLNDYVAGITRTISYSEDEREPTSKDFVLKNIDNSKQKELLIPFVDKIDSLSNNKDNRARIAISIIQNIPYDYSDKLKGRYAYQALYDNEGVCGEKSRLLASILREMGYGVALIDYENFGLSHEAVGIKCPLKYSYDNTGFCFVETTTPSIITNSKGSYLSDSCSAPKGATSTSCTQKLPDNYTLIVISDGNSFNSVLEEFNDAKELNRITNVSKNSGGYLDSSDYYKWKKLVKKYGLT